MLNLSKGFYEQRAKDTRSVVAGVDEVGRGCLAGPVYAAVVVLDLEKTFSLPKDQLNLIRDSKTLSKKQRKKSLEIIERISISSAVGVSSVETIDEKGIVSATFLAMHKSLAQLRSQVDLLLVDGNQQIPGYTKEQLAIVKGDSLSYSIAAASIVAKESRDNFMLDASSQFSNYGFSTNVGYGTKEHLNAIKNYGICSLHRKSFEPIKTIVTAG